VAAARAWLPAPEAAAAGVPQGLPAAGAAEAPAVVAAAEVAELAAVPAAAELSAPAAEEVVVAMPGAESAAQHSAVMAAGPLADRPVQSAHDVLRDAADLARVQLSGGP